MAPEYERIIDMTVAGTVDKDDLRALYQKYMTMGQGRYSDETWAVYEAAFGEAHRVLNDRAATQAQVNDARKALQSAVDGLEVVPVDLAANKPAMDLTMLQDFGSLPGRHRHRRRHDGDPGVRKPGAGWEKHAGSRSGNRQGQRQEL